ncbi:Protein of unknown function (DUF2892) [Albidovulum inexpectatum]|uniref:Inner membrane protein YgaP-like transmembrane domain-containing protein n=1 Tax=Albidovulum inexpectatum TaxID=196587 RepID=A0A2S5JKD5_9RHOB|nr:DUF2892 domain-containing protein [Albidovulum inexpectatum]PPB81725.1 Protein of unknown function (DUF2892) [Albidovulum inexpectatum]
MFKHNVGTTDRIIRIVVGLALIAWWYFSPGMGLRWLPLVLGIIALATGLLSTCPLYSILGINTCPMKKS